jgi:DNA-binding beta-propeller fold protein YncE
MGAYGTPVVVDTRPARQAGGCIAMLVVISVVGSLLIAGIALVGGFLPFLSLGDLGLGDIEEALGDAQETVADVTNQYPRQVLEFGGAGTGRGFFEDARHIGVDGDGTIYAADYGGGRVQVFDAAGEFQTQFNLGNDIYLTGMAVDRDGRLYVVYGSELYEVDGETGEEVRHIEIDEGWGFEDVVALPDGGLAATWYKNRDDLVILDSEGEVVAIVPEAISSITGEVAVTMKLTVDNDGNILVLNTNSEMIFKFSPEGEYLNSFGGDGDAPGQLSASGDLVVDNQGQIYVSDIRGIQVFDSTGRFIEKVKPSEVAYVYGMAVDDENFLYVVSDNHVRKYQLAADE